MTVVEALNQAIRKIFRGGKSLTLFCLFLKSGLNWKEQAVVGENDSEQRLQPPVWSTGTGFPLLGLLYEFLWLRWGRDAVTTG